MKKNGTISTVIAGLLTIAAIGPMEGFAKKHHHHPHPHHHHHHSEHASKKEEIKEKIGDAADTLKREVDKLSHDFAAIQEYLNNYPWKGLIRDETAAGPAVLAHMFLNNHHRATVVHPGEKVRGEVICWFDPQKCSNLSVYRVILGLKGLGPQTSIAPSLGAFTGFRTLESFTLVAPNEPGIYQVRFRGVANALESQALHHWKDEAGNEPDSSTTMGILIVKP